MNGNIDGQGFNVYYTKKKELVAVVQTEDAHYKVTTAVKDVGENEIRYFLIKWTPEEIVLHYDLDLLQRGPRKTLDRTSNPKSNLRHEYISVFGRYTSVRSYSNLHLLKISITRGIPSAEHSYMNSFEGTDIFFSWHVIIFFSLNILHSSNL